MTRGRLATVICSLTALQLTAMPIEARGQTPLSLSPPPRVLVMPFENVTREGRVFWLTEAASVLLTDDLNALGANAITRDERVEAFERLQVPPVAALTDATVIRLGQIVGAAEVIVGSLKLENDVLIVQARSIALEVGRVRARATERGSIPELFAIFERIARQIAPPSAKTTDEVERQHPTLVAFEDYVKGLLAETPGTATAYLTAALKAQPTFERARLALWAAYTSAGEYQQALTAVDAVPSTSPWSRAARFRAGLSQLDLKKYDAAFSTFKAIAGQPPSAAVMNNLGVVQLRRGGTPQTGQATYFFNQARELNPTDPDFFFNLGYAYWQDRDPQAAIYWLREAVRRNPADGEAHFVLAAALTAGGSAAEAAREKELAHRLSSAFEQWEKRPAADVIPKGLERVKSDVELPRGGAVDAALAANGQRDQQELARFYLDRGRRLFQEENDRQALADLNRALFLSPYLPEAHLLVGRIHLRNGRVREAIDALKISAWSADSAETHAALAGAYLQAKDMGAARAEAERALVLSPGMAEARRVLDQVK